MKIYAKGGVRCLGIFLALSLSACGEHDVDVIGVQIGMSRDQVAKAAPADSSLYCVGDGDTQFESIARLPASSTVTFCTWASGVLGSRQVTQVQLNGVSSRGMYVRLDQSGQVSSVVIGFQKDAYDTLVKGFQKKLGSSDSNMILGSMGGSTWIGRNGKLSVSIEGFGLNAETLVQLEPPPKAS